MKIFTETQGELNTIKKILKDSNINVIIFRPEDSFAVVAWSEKDLEDYGEDLEDPTPEGRCEAMSLIESNLKDLMISCGWDAMNQLLGENGCFKEQEV